MITKSVLKNGTSFSMVIILLMLAGLYSVFQLPIQLFPDIERPVISIQTWWRAASPREVEAEIIEPLEKVLRGMPEMLSMSAFANSGGFANVFMEFGLSTDMDNALLEVISRVNRMDPLPPDAVQPRISLGGRGDDGPALIFFFLQLLPGNPNKLEDYIQFMEDRVIPDIESIEGVAKATLRGGGNSEKILQIEIDVFKTAQLNIRLSQIERAVRGFNDVSGGSLSTGRRKFTLRYSGRYTPDDVGQIIVDWRQGSPVRLSDIASVSISAPKNEFFAVQNGNEAYSLKIDKESNANALKALNAVKERVAKINDTLLAPRQLTMAQSFDASVFIYRAINLVTSNLFLGIFLSLTILWYFLRHVKATFLIAITVPTSLLVTFIVLNALGRSLNVISLAGLAFAVGMVLDAAIVVLDNIMRKRVHGNDSFKASLFGAEEVKGALLASTLTTVAIFLPVIFLKEVEGQLFADLAITIAVAVVVSLLTALTLLPLGAMSFLQKLPVENISTFREKVVAKVAQITAGKNRRRWLSVSLITIPLLISLILFPEMDYLPPVKRDAVDTFLQIPPGSSKAYIKKEYIDKITKRMQPYMDGVKQPALKNYYILTWPGGGTIGTRALDQQQVGELEKVIKTKITTELPDLSAFSSQGNLFGSFGSDREIRLLIQHSDNAVMEKAASQAHLLLKKAIPGINARIRPGLGQREPELLFIPKDRKIQEVGFNRQEVGRLIRVLGDGVYLGEYYDGNKRLDIIMKAEDWSEPEALGNAPLATARGHVTTLNELVDMERKVGPSRISRVNQRRTITLNIRPNEDMSLEHVLDTIKTKVEPSVREILGIEGVIAYQGSASDLTRAIKNISMNFIFALFILFLLMSALFKSAMDSSMVVLAMPLAMVGGFFALQGLNFFVFQPLDLLTMIGFIILLGLVVNNAILLVYQSRENERAGLTRDEAVIEALKTRLKPIMMSTLTSIFGMLPLLLMPGTGSVIYRGLAAVIVGGMMISAIFTVILLPCLLRMNQSEKGVLQ